MPYILPRDLTERQLGQGRAGTVQRWFPDVAARAPARAALFGDYLQQKFVLPTNSLAGAYLPEIYNRPPFRTPGLGQGWLDESTMGVPNKYLLIGIAGAVILLSAGRRRR